MARCFEWCTLTICVVVSFFIMALIILFAVLLGLYSSSANPSFSINLLDYQALNMTRDDDSPTNLTIHFDLKLKNGNLAVGLFYPDPIILTFSYFPNVSMMVSLAEYKLDRFYQGNGKTRHVRDVVETNGFPSVLEGTDIVALRVDLVGSFRYKQVGTKKHKVEWGCIVAVNHTTNQKMQLGFIRMVKPGFDSKLEPPPDYVY